MLLNCDMGQLECHPHNSRSCSGRLGVRTHGCLMRSRLANITGEHMHGLVHTHTQLACFCSNLARAGRRLAVGATAEQPATSSWRHGADLACKTAHFKCKQPTLPTIALQPSSRGQKLRISQLIMCCHTARCVRGFYLRDNNALHPLQELSRSRYYTSVRSTEFEFSEFCCGPFEESLFMLQPGTPQGDCVYDDATGRYSRIWTNGKAVLDCATGLSELPFPTLRGSRRTTGLPTDVI
eukprot:20543_3